MVILNQFLSGFYIIQELDMLSNHILLVNRCDTVKEVCTSTRCLIRHLEIRIKCNTSRLDRFSLAGLIG